MAVPLRSNGRSFNTAIDRTKKGFAVEIVKVLGPDDAALDHRLEGVGREQPVGQWRPDHWAPPASLPAAAQN